MTDSIVQALAIRIHLSLCPKCRPLEMLISQDGSHQQYCSCVWMLPNMPAAIVEVPRVSHSHLPSLPGNSPRPAGRSDLLGQAPSHLLLFLWDLVHMLVVMPFEWSLSPSPVRLLQLRPSGLQSQMFWGGLSSPCWSPGLGILMWGSELSLLWENVCNIISLQSVGHPPGGRGIWLYHRSVPPPLLLLYVFSSRKSFLVVCSLFHQ